jgi:RNA-directed DNA polymerase
MAEELARYLRGWMEYFGNCETPSVLRSLEEWTRRRLRSAIWKQWKHGRKRFAELRKRGVGQDLAAKAAGSAHGPWQLANSPALAIALSERLLCLARDSAVDHKPVAQLTESPYTDPYVR